jgi:glycosyltransferase involved in cell wall biosynthesis
MQETGKPPRLSIIVPAFNRADTLQADIGSLEEALRECEPSYEVLVVIDGGDEATLEAARRIDSDRVAIWHYPDNQGKGFAVMTGMLRARGSLVGFFDAGGDIDPSVWPIAIAEQRDSRADIVVGSKRHRESVVGYPIARSIYSIGYQLLTRVLFRINVRDTQVGIKLFRADVIRAIAPRLLVKQFAFDIELLALARHFGFTRISDVPVTIQYDFNSSISFTTVFRMLLDTLAVFYRLRLIRYYDRIDKTDAWQDRVDESPATRVT